MSSNFFLYSPLAPAEVEAARLAHGENVLPPPLPLPSWLCCLLPLLSSFAAVRVLKSIGPADANLLRATSADFVLYDADNAVVGDVLKVQAGERVPADCTVLAVGAADEGEGEAGAGVAVDEAEVTGVGRRRVPVGGAVHAGGTLLEGWCVCRVTAVGRGTRLGRLILAGKFPIPDKLKSGGEGGGGGEEETVQLLSGGKKS
ncbi:hypothetical protein TeGR_g6309 [Tetraparma gracilis]|uniref:P-type ATPase A domain-containing protein n=1 Tax=Tetraparma gracilis TaxID=2962635 RepID=A0ABQ6M7A1_9STRA|nr:hypothetical protein TeGR_g6309 [Tetraparma gracilis]